MHIKCKQCKYLNLTLYQPLSAPCTAELGLGKAEAAQGSNWLCYRAHVLTWDVLIEVESRGMSSSVSFSFFPRPITKDVYIHHSSPLVYIYMYIYVYIYINIYILYIQYMYLAVAWSLAIKL